MLLIKGKSGGKQIWGENQDVCFIDCGVLVFTDQEGRQTGGAFIIFLLLLLNLQSSLAPQLVSN